MPENRQLIGFASYINRIRQVGGSVGEGYTTICTRPLCIKYWFKGKIFWEVYKDTLGDFKFYCVQCGICFNSTKGYPYMFDEGAEPPYVLFPDAYRMDNRQRLVLLSDERIEELPIPEPATFVTWGNYVQPQTTNFWRQVQYPENFFRRVPGAPDGQGTE